MVVINLAQIKQDRTDFSVSTICSFVLFFRTSAHCPLWEYNSASGILWSNGYNQISEAEWLPSATCVFLSPSRAIWRVPHWFCTEISAGSLCSVYIHSLIHLTHTGDGGLLGNEAFTSSPWPICLQWAVAAQTQIAEKIHSLLVFRLT